MDLHVLLHLIVGEAQYSITPCYGHPLVTDPEEKPNKFSFTISHSLWTPYYREKTLTKLAFLYVHFLVPYRTYLQDHRFPSNPVLDCFLQLVATQIILFFQLR